MMKCTLIILVVVGVGMTSLSAQTITPSAFNLVVNSYGVPEYFPVTFKNTANAPRKVKAWKCTGYGGVDLDILLQSDSSDYNTFVQPGASIALLFRLLPWEASGLTQLTCSVTYVDTLDKGQGSSGYSISGGPTTQGLIHVATTDIDFGNVSDTATTTKSFVLRNNGDGPAIFRAIKKPLSPFTIINDKDWYLDVDDSVVISVTFRPRSPRDYADTIEFGHALVPTSGSVAVYLRGSLVLPQPLVFTPDHFEQGPSSIGVPEYFPVVIKNTSEEVLLITDFSNTGSGTVVFKFLYPDTTLLPTRDYIQPGESQSRLLQVLPRSDSVIALSCEVICKDSKPSRIVGGTFSIIGEAPRKAVFADYTKVLEFGDVFPNTVVLDTIVLRNTGPGKVCMRILQAPITPYSLDNDSILCLKPNDYASYVISFQHDILGKHNGVISFEHAYIDDPSLLIAVQFRARVVGITDVTESIASSATAYPNPSSGAVSWTSKPLTQWHIINSVGERVATVMSDEQGACSWSTSTSSMYTIVSQRGEPAMRVMIVK